MPRGRMDWDRVKGRFHLTDRQLEVARLMHRGLPFKRMAAPMGCSHHTVDSHRRELYKKVGANRRDQVLLKITLVGLRYDDPEPD